ncbi:MAG: alpha/beta fold hydrolase [Chloroflexi bacterium]|nr:alpha/beta fold hydrolase [Chloroflexota bacterium]
MLVFGIFWIACLGILILIGVGFAASLPLMRRRMPDRADDPRLHGVACDEVHFASRDGLVLGGWWIPGSSPVSGTVILCPGQNGSMDKDIPQALPLQQAGYNVLMFDFRAHGRSEGEVVSMGAFEQADLFGALDYLSQEREIERVGVLGFSMGAGVALMVAAQDERIAALVVDGAFPRLDGILAGYMRIKGIPALLARGLAWLTLIAGSLRTHYQLYRANPILLADRIRIPVYFIHGALDLFVSTAEIEALAARVAGPTELWRVYDAGHREAFSRHIDDYNRRVVAWFDQHLTV